MKTNLYFQQLFELESSTYTYLLADKSTNEAIVIDPVLETAERDLKLINELGFKLLYILETHVHADHITGAAVLKKSLKAKTVVGLGSHVQCADILISDDQELQFGKFKIKALETPGHTDSCMSYLIENMVFTGDALLIRSAGRTDFQQGSSEKLFKSVNEKLYSLPDETILYPAHDYKGLSASTIGEEKKYNPRINVNRSMDEFKKIMGELKLAQPKKIHVAVPANLKCGEKEA